MKDRENAPKRPRSALYLNILSILVGAVSGLGAVVFRGLIAVCHNLLFLGSLSWSYDANAHTPPSPWGFGVIFVPVLGALGVVFLVKTFAPEAKGHGVPEVMDAIYYEKGVIRPIVAAVKSLASALSIGSGGAVGREGPIIQIGSSFGSTLGQLVSMPTWQRITLIAAGTGGGIAATFNTPVGGVLFATEIMLHEVSARTLVPVAIATATATYIGRVIFGTSPSFVIPAFETSYFHLTTPMVLVGYAGLGLLTGLLSLVYIKSIYGFEDAFERRIRSSYSLRHTTGMLLVGLMMYASMTSLGHYYIEGVGYATIQDILSGTLRSLWLLLLLCALKLLATSLTLGSGASGGIFSPALYMGATLGASYGTVLGRLFPSLDISPPAFAVAGMAGLVGGSTGAALAAIVMIFEMTLDYNVIIPLTVTVAISYGVRKKISRESIYTMKLARRGHHVPDSLRADIHLSKRARSVMDTRFGRVDAASTIDDLAQEIEDEGSSPHCFVVTKGDEVLGVIYDRRLPRILERTARKMQTSEIADRQYSVVPSNATLLGVMAKMQADSTEVALVMKDTTSAKVDKVEGMITKAQVANALGDSLELFSD